MAKIFQQSRRNLPLENLKNRLIDRKKTKRPYRKEKILKKQKLILEVYQISVAHDLI